MGEALRPKKCKACGERFEPSRPLQVACTPRCGISWTRTLESRKKRKELREARQRLKTRSDWVKDAQRAFNAYIRERDKDEPCISCGRSSNAKRNAGHYRTTAAAPELRFSEDNCHGQCEHCNSFQSGNIVEYRLRLIRKIGQERVDYLEGPHPNAKWTIDELRVIRDEYRRRLRVARSG